MSTETLAEYVPGTLTADKILHGFLCPVCGNALSAPPLDFTICPCCGTEFGNDDQDWTHEQLRNAWLDKGAPWWSNSQPAPNNWNPIEQVLWVMGFGSLRDLEAYSISDVGPELFQVGFNVWITWKVTATSEG